MRYLIKFNENIVNERLVSAKRIKNVEDFYTNRCSRDVKNADVVGWGNKDSQYKRFNIFNRYIKSGDSILDYGCGVGDLYGYFHESNKKINYLGVDIQQIMIDRAQKKYPDANFTKVRGIGNVNDYKYDWVLASGVFTIGMNRKDVLEFFRKASESASKGVIANFLDTDKKVIDLGGNRSCYGPYIHYNMNKLKGYLEKNLNVNLTCEYGYEKSWLGRNEDFTLILKK